MREKILKRLFIIFTIVIILVSIFTLGIMLGIEKSYMQEDKNTEKISILGEYYVEGEYEKKLLPLDNNMNLSGSKKVIITGNLSENIPENKQVIMRIDNMLVNIFVNGNKVYSFGEKGSFPKYARSPGSGWGNFISPGITKADEIRIELENIYTNHVNDTFSSFLDNLYSGYESEIILDNIRGRIFNYSIAILAISIGIIALIFSFKAIHMKKLMTILLSFAFMSISSGVWFSVDFETQSYITNYPVFNNSLDIIVLLLSLVSLLIYFSAYLKSKCKKLLLIVASSILSFIVIAIILQFSGIRDYYDFVPIIYLLGIISAISIISSVFYEWNKFKYKELKPLLVSTVLICSGILADIIFMMLQILSHIFWIKIGYILFLIIQLLNVAESIKGIMSENIKVQVLKEIAYKDMLTDAKNRTAYTERVNEIEESLSLRSSFGVVVFDINDLKVVNDTLGHKEGDNLIINAFKIICSIFNEENVYRLGGDEFVAILEDVDYYKCNNLIEEFKDTLVREDRVSIACGGSIYDRDRDRDYEDVFKKADRNMYINKRDVKKKNQKYNS